MDFVKGVVKKYFRSYNRTLKDGTKKTYKTEQIQVTIPKSDNIFEDKEEVIILSSSQAEEIEDSIEMQRALELFNTMVEDDNQQLEDELNKLKEELEINNSKIDDYNSGIKDLKLELEEYNKKNHFLEDKCSDLKMQIEEDKATIESLESKIKDKNFIISDLNDNLNKLNEKIDAKNSSLLGSNFIGESNEDDVIALSPIQSIADYDYTHYIDLQRQYIALLNKYEKSQEDLYNEKVKVIHYKNLLDKFKNFILRIQ
ncbi:hypothetical protein SAMN02910297_01330 [Methanobrevibacter olleyae]|uniref:Uncharacterized protein n=1 Tax=Methanobrevibacter olleyae TaxID=294671 RepID=A0A1I4J3E5_METOL|nr:hypothetical protein [Methanobrevibacter olleyae]SFL61115.1 hypothetical protein SAMN02910297_01330 [Methanobrevibacter olleyae]